MSMNLDLDAIFDKYFNQYDSNEPSKNTRPIIKDSPKESFDLELTSKDKPNKKISQRKPSIVELERNLISRTPFIVINDLVYHYDENVHYYKLVNQDDVIGLYRYYVDPNLNDVSSLHCFNDLYRCIKTDPSLKRTLDSTQETCCPLKDGIYFFRDGKIYREDHSPKYITFICLDASYIPLNLNSEGHIATCPSFVKFVKDITGNREDLINRLFMALGYLLVETQKGKFFFLAGFQPDSGKSVLFNFIQRLFPPEAVSNLPIGDLGGRFESESLLTSRINISLDLPQEPLSASAVAKIKQLTGGDTVEVQRKNKTSKKIDHPVKLVFAANHPIFLKKDDKAFWNRLIFLPFMNTVKEEEKDTELGNKLWAERHAIVTLLLHYAQELERMNYEFPPIDEDKLKGYVQKSTEDYIFGFIQERCEIGTNEDFCSVAAIWKEFKNYQQKNPGPYCTHTEFNKFMECHGFYRVHKSDVRGFLGIKVKERPINIFEDIDWKGLSKTKKAKKLAKKFFNEDE